MRPRLKIVKEKQRFAKNVLILYSYIIYFSLMFNENDHFLSFGEKGHLLKLFIRAFFDTNI